MMLIEAVRVADGYSRTGRIDTHAVLIMACVGIAYLAFTYWLLTTRQGRNANSIENVGESLTVLATGGF